MAHLSVTGKREHTIAPTYIAWPILDGCGIFFLFKLKRQHSKNIRQIKLFAAKFGIFWTFVAPSATEHNMENQEYTEEK